MSGLIDKAGSAKGVSEGGFDIQSSQSRILQAHQAWEESMLRQLDELKASVIALQPQALAYRCGGIFQDGQLVLTYWGRQVAIGWPDLQARFLTGEACPVFDTTLLLFYLRSADGEPLGDRWISFRELPGGAFYHQAYQGYSGDQMARYFVDRQAAFHEAARALDGVHLQSLAEFAYAFLPLPRIRLAAILWPGDEEFPTRGQVLFDAAASHYMTTDGLAILGAGLARRLERVVKP